MFFHSKELPKPKSSGIPPPSQAAPPPPPGGNGPPPLPSSSSRPSYHQQQRPPVPAAPPPSAGTFDEDLYDDPGDMAAMDYEASVPGPPLLPNRGFQQQQQQQQQQPNHGYTPQEPSDIYGRDVNGYYLIVSTGQFCPGVVMMMTMMMTIMVVIVQMIWFVQSN